jgi:hypothetical protein
MTFGTAIDYCIVRQMTFERFQLIKAVLLKKIYHLMLLNVSYSNKPANDHTIITFCPFHFLRTPFVFVVKCWLLLC